MGQKPAKHVVHPSSTLRGLYPTCDWDARTIRGLIVNKHLAPITAGAAEETRPTSLTAIVPSQYEEECPICFLFYKGGLNRTTCCTKSMCTECFLQVRPPTRQVACPFCNRDPLSVTYSGPLSLDDIRRDEKDRASVEAHEQRLLTEARKSSNARQLAPHDFGISPDAVGQPTDAATAPTVNNDAECSADTASENDDKPSRTPVVAPNAAAVADAVVRDRDDDDDDSATTSSITSANKINANHEDDSHDGSGSDDGDVDAPPTLSGQRFSVADAVRIAANIANSTAVPPAAAPRFFGSAADHVPRDLDTSGMTLMQLEQAMLEEAIRMSLATTSAAPDVVAPAVAVAGDVAPNADVLAADVDIADVASLQQLNTLAAMSSSSSTASSLASSPRRPAPMPPTAVQSSSSGGSNSNRSIVATAAVRVPLASSSSSSSSVKTATRSQRGTPSSAANRRSGSHVRTSSTSSRSDEQSANESVSESWSLDPANRNSSLTVSSPPCSSSTSCADVSDPEDDVAAPASLSPRSSRYGSSNNSSRRRRKATSSRRATFSSSMPPGKLALQDDGVDNGAENEIVQM